MGKNKTTETGRRRYVRHHMYVPVELATENGPIDAAATTLAVGGLFVQCEEPLVPGTHLKVTLTLGEEQLTIPSLVVHDGDYGMGVEFVDIARPDLLRIRQYFRDNKLNMLTPDQEPPPAA